MIELAGWIAGLVRNPATQLLQADNIAAQHLEQFCALA